LKKSSLKISISKLKSIFQSGHNCTLLIKSYKADLCSVHPFSSISQLRSFHLSVKVFECHTSEYQMMCGSAVTNSFIFCNYQNAFYYFHVYLGHNVSVIRINIFKAITFLYDI
jgi:hypothetical protein